MDSLMVESTIFDGKPEPLGISASPKNMLLNLRGSSTLRPRFLYCFLIMNCREINNAIEVRFFAFSLFIYILSTKILLIFYCLQFDCDLTLKYPLRKMYTKTVDTI